MGDETELAAAHGRYAAAWRAWNEAPDVERPVRLARAREVHVEVLRLEFRVWAVLGWLGTRMKEPARTGGDA